MWDEWGSWFRDTAGGVIQQWSAAEYAIPAPAPATETPAVAPDGSMYQEGQPAGGGITIGKDAMVLIGIGLVAVLLLSGD